MLCHYLNRSQANLFYVFLPHHYLLLRHFRSVWLKVQSALNSCVILSLGTNSNVILVQFCCLIPCNITQNINIPPEPCHRQPPSLVFVRVKQTTSHIMSRQTASRVSKISITWSTPPGSFRIFEEEELAAKEAGKIPLKMPAALLLTILQLTGTYVVKPRVLHCQLS